MKIRLLLAVLVHWSVLLPSRMGKHQNQTEPFSSSASDAYIRQSDGGLFTTTKFSSRKLAAR